jgi:hypothetical protein
MFKSARPCFGALEKVLFKLHGQLEWAPSGLGAVFVQRPLHFSPPEEIPVFASFVEFDLYRPWQSVDTAAGGGDFKSVRVRFGRDGGIDGLLIPPCH